MALGFSTIKIYELEKIISDYTLTSVCHNDVHEYIFKWFILKGFLKYQAMFPTLKHCLPLVFKGGFFLKMWLWYRGCFTAVKFTILKKTIHYGNITKVKRKEKKSAGIDLLNQRTITFIIKDEGET